MMMVDNDFNLQNVSFNCDFYAYQIKSVIFSATALDVHILITNLTSISNINTIQIEIGYGGKSQQGKDIYNPIMVSSKYAGNTSSCVMNFFTSSILKVVGGENLPTGYFSFSISICVCMWINLKGKGNTIWRKS